MQILYFYSITHKKSMKRYLILTLLILAGKLLQAQEIVYDFTGQPVLVKKYEEYEGSPFLYDEWKKGSVKLKNGKEYSNLDLKYDAAEDRVLFKDDRGNTYKFNDPVSEFRLNSQLYRSGYQADESRTPDSFYQVLVDGNTQLLKRVAKTIAEQKTYGSAVLKKHFQSTESFFIVKAGKLKKVRKDKKAIFDALGGNAAEMEQYIASNKLNLKIDNDMAMLISYYNSL
jgi:hypothetical protein